MAFSVMKSVNRASTTALKSFLLAGNTSLSRPFSAANEPSVAAADDGSYSQINNLRMPSAEIRRDVFKEVRDSLMNIRSTGLNGLGIKKIPCYSHISPPDGDDYTPTSGIRRPLSEILNELNKKVPDSLIKVRTGRNGHGTKEIPWHIVNRIMNLHAPEWSGEVRSITYSADGKRVSVIYRVTIYGTDAEIHRESIGTVPVFQTGHGDPVQKAESMAFRRACARFGLGLHLYHEDMM